jgi:hypothetical protein
MKAVLIHVPNLPWECIARDNAAQLVPTLFAMIESGSAGPLPAVGPDPLMDGVILTGRRPADSGLLTRLAPRPDGFATDLATAMHLKSPAVTDFLDAAGVPCASVNLRATGFGALPNGVVASDAFFEIRARTFDDWGIPPGALAPLAMAEELADLRVHPEDLLPEQLGPLMSREPQGDSAAQLRTMARALAESSGAHSVATHLVEHGAYDVCMVRYAMFAQLAGQFAEPASMPTGRGAAWLLIELLDKFIARLKFLAGEDTVFMVTGGLEAKPFWIAQGPGIPGDELWPACTSLYDVAPSLLALFGLKHGSMPGSARMGRQDLAQANAPAVADSGAPADLAGFAGIAAAAPSAAQREILERYQEVERHALAQAAIAEAAARSVP